MAIWKNTVTFGFEANIEVVDCIMAVVEKGDKHGFKSAYELTNDNNRVIRWLVMILV